MTAPGGPPHAATWDANTVASRDRSTSCWSLWTAWWCLSTAADDD